MREEAALVTRDFISDFWACMMGASGVLEPIKQKQMMESRMQDRKIKEELAKKKIKPEYKRYRKDNKIQI